MSMRTESSVNAVLRTYIPVAEAIGALLYPHAEVVLHDLAAGTVFHIVNGFSRRAIGDASLLGDLPGLDESTKVLGPYDTASPRGERVKAASAVLTDASSGQRIGMLCINLDVSKFDAAKKILEDLIAPDSAEPPGAIFAYDWRAEINQSLRSYLEERGKVLDALTCEERSAFVQRVAEQRVFDARHAVGYVATQLGVTKATIYNYLNQGSKAA